MHRRELLAGVILMLGPSIGFSRMASADIKDEVAKWLLGTWRGTWKHRDGRPGGSFTLKVVPCDESDDGYCDTVAIFEPSFFGDSKPLRVARDRVNVGDNKSIELEQHWTDAHLMMRFDLTDRFGGEGQGVVHISQQDSVWFVVAADKQ